MVGELGSSGFLIFLAVIVVGAAIIWLIYDILQRRDMSIGMKALWMVLAILFSIVTLIVYVLFFRKRSVSQR
jgi:Phospholipase_D-nuclease N-terminal